MIRYWFKDEDRRPPRGTKERFEYDMKTCRYMLEWWEQNIGPVQTDEDEAT